MKTLIKKFKSLAYIYLLISIVVVAIMGFLNHKLKNMYILNVMFNEIILILFIIPSLLLVSNKEVNVLFKNELIYRYGSKKKFIFAIFAKMVLISIILAYIYIFLSKIIVSYFQINIQRYVVSLTLSFFLMFMVLQVLNTIFFAIIKNKMISMLLVICLLISTTVFNFFLKIQNFSYEYFFIIYKSESNLLLYLLFDMILFLILASLLIFLIKKIEAYGYEKIKK